MAQEVETVWIVQRIKRPGCYMVISVHKTEESASKYIQTLADSMVKDHKPVEFIAEEFILHP